MAKNMYSKSTNIKIVGTLEKNEDGDYIVTVDYKDGYKEYDLKDILEEMVDTEISLSSVDEIV